MSSLLICSNGSVASPAPPYGAESVSLPEDSLIHLAQQGDEAAFEELMRRAYNRCVRLALCMLHDPQDASDEVQNAFWRAYKHLGTFDQRAKFSTWVGRIVINQCRVRLRRNRRYRTMSYDTPQGDSGTPLLLNLIVEKEDPEKQLGREEVQHLIRLEVYRIPKVLSRPLELHYFCGLTVEEVSCHLGISVAATKSRLHRAYRYLRERMARHLGCRGAATLAA